MLGIGNDMMRGANIAVPQTILINGTDSAVVAANDEFVGFVQALFEPNVTGVADHARVPGLEANVTIIHTHGEDGADITDVSETLVLYAYRVPGAVSQVFLSTDASGSYANTLGLDLTTINSGSIAAVGSGNKYTFKINHFSKPGYPNSSAVDTFGPVTISAA